MSDTIPVNPGAGAYEDAAPAPPGSDHAALAAAIINTTSLPPGLLRMREMASEAEAYHALNPYPRYAFTGWKTEDLGPLPRCMPLAKSIVKRGAKWLFGRPIQINCAGNTTLETALRDAWRGNRMGSRMVPAAERAGRRGGLVLKYAIDEKNIERPITIQSLDYIDQVRLFFDPHDRDRLLMARVQYPFFDPVSNKTWWYREEWTDAEEVHYEPLPQAKFASLNNYTPDTFNGWQISAREKNPFERIPLTVIRNLETDDVWGSADLWNLIEETNLFRILDRINMAFAIMDRSNQFDGNLNPITIDADVDEQDIDKPLQPGQPWDIKSEEGSAHQARVIFPTGQNSLRPAMMDYVKDLRAQLYEAASSVAFEPENFTNKGNLTEAVLEMIFQLQIEITEEKHKSYGEHGLKPFLENLALGAQAAGMSLGVRAADRASYSVEIKWAPYFGLSEDEKTARVARVRQEEVAGYTTHERAIDAVAQMEGVEDLEALKEELAQQPPPEPPAAPLPDEKPDLPGAVPVTNRPL